MNNQNNNLVGAPYEKKKKKCQTFNFDECSKWFSMDPFILNDYNLFSQNIESSLEQ